MCNTVDPKFTDCRYRDYRQYTCINLNHCCGRVEGCQSYDPLRSVPPASKPVLGGIKMKQAWIDSELKHAGMKFCACGTLMEEAK